MKRKRFIIVGIGNIGRDLLARLSKDYELLVIDNAPDAEARAKKIRGDGVSVLGADATSRLVLEGADVDNAEAVVITTTSEKVNIEVARVLMEHFHPKRVIAVGITTSGISALEKLGAEVLYMFATSAATLRNMLEQTAKTATAIGLGKNEILEVEIHPHSRLANKQLGSLAPIRWKVGLLYREGDIIVPDPETVLKPKDRVIILGDPAALKTVSEIMTFCFQKFPLEYGSVVLACLSGVEDERYFKELGHLFTIFPFDRIVFVYSTRAAARAEEYRRMIAAQPFRGIEERMPGVSFFLAAAAAVEKNGQGYGMIVLSGGALQQGWPPEWKRLLANLSRTAACPILVCRGTFPYEKAVVPVVEGIDPTHALETALEVASSVNTDVAVLFVRPSPYIAADADLKAFDAAKRSVSELSLMYETSVDVSVLAGNPVRSVLKALPAYNIQYMETGNFKQQNWLAALLAPDVLWHIMKKAPVTTMLVPPVEESL